MDGREGRTLSGADPGLRQPSSGDPGRPVGLYVHVPFCAAICDYCTFTRQLLDPALAAPYAAAVVDEIRRSPDAGAPADSLFFGGGTPSVLAPSEIGAIVRACAETFRLADCAEVTLEANPETVTGPGLEAYRAAGVNRLSLGVQSFRDEELRRLGRLHDAARARHSVALARRAGFDNVSLDLMLWLPGQSMADWRFSVEALVGLTPEHASLYLLELYPGLPLHDAVQQPGWARVSDDEAADMYLWAMERLEAVGLAQYEISNVARPGMSSRHNLKYWTGGDWIGFGCAAHSTRCGERWNNVPGVRDYIARVSSGRGPAAARQHLSAADLLEERLFMGLRLTDGVDLADVGLRFDVDVWARYGYRLFSYLEAGLLLREAGRLRLTRKGMLLANEVMSVFVGARSTNA